MPSNKSFLITPDDSNLLPPVIEGATGVAIYVGTGGVVKFLDPTSSVETLTIASGAVIDVLARKVFATGTTASNMVGIYELP